MIIRFLGSSGQNVKDIKSYSRITDPLDVLEKTLDWAHMSPTAPDTLSKIYISYNQRLLYSRGIIDLCVFQLNFFPPESLVCSLENWY